MLTGVSGAGKSRRVIEVVNEARSEGRPAFTFANSDSYRLMSRDSIRVDRVLSCRAPGVVSRLDHLCSTTECAEIVATIPKGTLVAFDEAHEFGTAIVPVWLDASRRGLEVLVATPSVPQLEMLEGNDFEHTTLSVTCQKCGDRDATDSIVVPGEDATLALCEPCMTDAVEQVRAEVVERLQTQPPHPGEKALYQPVELAETVDWKVIRKDSEARATTMIKILRELGIVPVSTSPPPNYLDIACNTGYFCHFLRRQGFHSVGVDVVEGDIAVCRLLDSYFRRDHNEFVAADAVDYLRSTRDRHFDVTSQFSVFPWIAMQSSIERAIESVELQCEKTTKVGFFEIGYSTEDHYKGRLPVEIDREWILSTLDRVGGFDEIRVLEGRDHGLTRDLFVGIKPGVARQ